MDLGSSTSMENVQTQAARELQESIVRFIDQSLQSYTSKNLAVGRMEPFDEKIESWANYVERFELYCEANDVPAQKKTVMFLTVMGSKMYNTFRDICAPEKPRQQSYEKILETIKQHLEPKPLNINTERFKFGNCRQGDESLQVFIEKLKDLALKCDFGDEITTRLRDQFLLGLTSERIRNRLLTEKLLTWNKAVKIASNVDDEQISEATILNLQTITKPSNNQQVESVVNLSENDQKENRRCGRNVKRPESDVYSYETNSKRQKILNERREMPAEKDDEYETEIHNLKLENKKLRLELEETNRVQKELTVLNRDLQSRLVNDYEELRTSLANVCASDLNNQSGSAVLPVGYVRRIDKHVHLGRDVWIPKSTFDTVMCTARNPSIFIKNMALAVFGHETLERSSVTGQLSNRTRKFYEGPPKQKLDPTKILAIKDVFRYWLQDIKKVDECTMDIELRKVGSYIGHKIADLNRRKKDTEEAQKTTEEFTRSTDEFQRNEIYQSHYQRGSQSSQRSSLNYDRNPECYDLMMVNVKSETNEANDESINGSNEAVFIPEEKTMADNDISVEDVNDDVNNVEDHSFISYL